VSAYLEAALDCVVVADASGCVVEFNPAAVRTFGYSREQALGRTLAELIVPPALRQRHSEAFERFAATGEGRLLGQRLELTGMRADGSEFPIELALSRVEGEPLLVCGALRDLTDAKRAEDDLRRHAAEHAALRRVATLVANGAPPAEVFAAVAEGVAELLDVPAISMVRFDRDGTASKVAGWGESPFPVGSRWALDDPSVMALTAETGRPARIDDYAKVPGRHAERMGAAGIRSAVGVPITVDGGSWGVILAFSWEPEPFSDDAEAQLARFTELVATAIANAQARDDLRKLADEQAALRGVATLVARGAEASELFARVAEEVAHVLDAPLIGMARYETDGSSTLIGAWGHEGRLFAPGTRLPPHPGLWAEVRRTGRPARVESYAGVGDAVSTALATDGARAGVGVPITVNDDIWGVVSALSTDEKPLPDDIEARLVSFTELVATAIANTQARYDLRQLADEQAALRTVATLVAEGAESRGVFDAVCEETGRLLGARSVNLARFTSDGFNLTMAGWSVHDTHVPTGTRLPLEGETINTIVRRTRAPARVDSYEGVEGELAELIRRREISSEVGAPVIVEGETWGALIAGWDGPEPSPEGTERRLASFAELIATAVSNAANRSELIASRARIVAAADQERRRIERNLHDGVQQQLVALQLELKTVEAGIPADLEPIQQDPGASASGAGNRARRRARDLARRSSGNAFPVGAGAGAANADASLTDPGRPRDRPARSAARLGGDRLLLRRLRGAGKRDQARPGKLRKRRGEGVQRLAECERPG